MTAIRPDIATSLPSRMIGRPIDHRGYPVPWFVTNKTPDDLWDFVHIDAERVEEAWRHRKCFVSGEPLGSRVAFVIGPMCTINRVASDAPCIPEIAKWAARVCPFMTSPYAKRPDASEGQADTPGIMVMGNPGLAAVWITKTAYLRRDGLFNIGNALEVTWWHKGQEVTGSQIAQDLYEKSAANLRAKAEAESPEALAHFNTLKARADQTSPTQGQQPCPDPKPSTAN